MTSLSKRIIPIRSFSAGEGHSRGNEERLAAKSEEIMQREEEAESFFEQRKQQAEKLLNGAKARAEREREALEEEREAVFAAAREEAYESGYTEGMQQAEARYDSLIAKLNNLIDQAEEERMDKIKSAEMDVLHIAMHAAKNILGQSLQDHPEQFQHLVAEAVKEVADQPAVSIYVHPDFYEQVAVYREELRKTINSEAHVSVYVKHFDDPLDCYVESPFGRIDASVDSQLDLIRKAVIELVKEGE
ncbi:flagellar assembly protein FliH [Salimicrobium humidisoli]|uniref:Flagellar assembly protein FliH n=1 Tax=Salimicrobium humidisoli TaxID=2029857 RepID=A0ABX4HS16_9BACI|nr:flagellar assembly protein FliH [Salimicrobium humidisoli]